MYNNHNEKLCYSILQPLHHLYPLPSMETQLTPSPVDWISSPGILPSPGELASAAQPQLQLLTTPTMEEF